MSENITWKALSKEKVFDTKIMDIYQKTCLSPEKVEREFITAKTRNWVMIIPEVEIEGVVNFLMVKQWRYGSESLSVEFPGGVIDAGETAEEAAKRELLEETGYEALALEYLTHFSPNPAFMENTQYVFIAKCDKKPAKELDLDKDEFINVLIEPRENIVKKYGKSPYDHALHCAGLFYYLKQKNLLLV
ncbi:MAG: NUDIX hydrolase [Treponemataceae bacterium]